MKGRGLLDALRPASPRLAPTPGWPAGNGWSAFLDRLSDPILVIDTGSRVAFANTAALRLVPCESGTPVARLTASLGAEAVGWLTGAAGGGPTGPPPPARLADGREAALAWQRLDERHAALRLVLPLERPWPEGEPATVGVTGPLREALRMLWDSPFPVSLQGDDFRFVDVNAAFVEFSGRTREALIGIDSLELVPAEDHAGIAESRQRAAGPARCVELAYGDEGRLIDAGGRERWFRAARRAIGSEEGALLYLAVLQETTSEHVARERADRSARELDDWFDLSPVGMVLFDDSGLMVRTNPAFDEIAGRVPVSLAEGAPDLAQLLAWGDDVALARLVPGSRAVERHGRVLQADGTARRLRAFVRCYRTAGGRRRYMGVVEDRSVEEERDLAQMQIGALMDSAGVGVATFEESTGWVRQRQPAGGVSSAVLQNITRDLVVAESLPEFERLQRALKKTERAEVRYAIRHPELGQRWLLTRVEPAVLSGKKTASVVTLDVTDQQLSQRRSQELLREMTTILESTTTGIAYLREGRLVRCNRRFEAMLRLSASGSNGLGLVELLSRHPNARLMAAEIEEALRSQASYEIEFALAEGAGEPAADAGGPAGAGAATGDRWYSLSVRLAGDASDGAEAIAVLSDVTRMKLQQVELEILARDRELMFSLSDVGIAFVRDGRIQRANTAFAQLTGWPAEDVPTLDLAELFVAADDDGRQQAQDDRDLRLHGRAGGERPLRRRDGRQVWVQMAMRLVNQGDPTGGVIASYVDVDARHRAERAVALQAERTRSVLDSVLVGIVTVGPAGIEWMNRSARRMFAGSLGDFVDQPISVVATPEADHPFRQTRYLDDLVEGQAETFECRVRARDGREFWIVGNAVATGRESAGRQLTYALLDIERRRQAEAAAGEAQASLRRVIEAAPLAIAMLDARSLAIVEVNEVAARSARSDRERLIGQVPEQIFAAEVAAQRRADMVQALTTSEVTVREYRIHVDGEPAVWDARYVPLAAAPGQSPDQLLLVATDVTEQRAAQEARFAAALSQREMLVKEVHHRIKNNLQGVAGLLQQIALRKPEVAGAIDEVVGQVQAIAQVYGLQVGASGPLAIVDVLEAITASVQRTFGRTILSRVAGREVADWALPEAEAIPVALTLNELLTNAVKHTPDAAAGGEIVCTLVCDAAAVRIAVSNPARLPAGFSLGRIPSGVSGLGLVRALLPRRSASLGLEQQGDRVVATVLLSPPSVTRLTDGRSESPPGG